MPKYELKGAYITSFATNGGAETSTDDAFDFKSSDEGGTENAGPFSYEEIKFDYPTLDPKSGADQSNEDIGFVAEVDGTGDHQTPKGFTWIDIKRPPKPPMVTEEDLVLAQEAADAAVQGMLDNRSTPTTEASYEGEIDGALIIDDGFLF